MVRRMAHDSGMNLSRHLHSGTDGQRMLRAALLGNAAFSALSAACLLLLPDDIIALAGFPLLDVRAILGYILLLDAVWLVSIVLKRDIKLGQARIVVAMDVAWTVLSIPIAMFSPLTYGGRWLVAAVAAAVSSFAFLQWRGIQIVRGNSIAPKHA